MMEIETNITLQWQKCSDSPFAAREGQCCCTCDSKLYVFGGVLQSNDGNLNETNELGLQCFDTGSLAWQKVAYKNDGPHPRSAATMVGIGKKLYLFGGLNEMCGWLDDFNSFDTESLTWSKIQPEGQGPCARDKLQAVAIDTKIYFFGGFGPKASLNMEDDDDDEYEDEEELPDDQDAAEFGWFNDLYVYDTVTNQWSQPLQMNLGVPTPRAAHGMCSVGKKLVIMGGRDTEDRQNDIHMFDTETRKWDTDMKCKGKPPSPRSFHTVSAVGNRVVVLGGRGKNNEHFSEINIFDLDSKEWYQPKLTGDIPCGRGQHSAAVINDRLFMFGGSSNFSPEVMHCQEIHTDMYMLKTDDILKGGPVAKKVNGQEMPS